MTKEEIETLRKITTENWEEAFGSTPEWFGTFVKFQDNFHKTHHRPEAYDDYANITKKEIQKIFNEKDFPNEPPPFDESTWPSKNNYAYVFPVNPNEEVKICYYGEEEND